VQRRRARHAWMSPAPSARSALAASRHGSSTAACTRPPSPSCARRAPPSRVTRAARLGPQVKWLPMQLLSRIIPQPPCIACPRPMTWWPQQHSGTPVAPNLLYVQGPGAHRFTIRAGDRQVRLHAQATQLRAGAHAAAGQPAVGQQVQVRGEQPRRVRQPLCGVGRAVLARRGALASRTGGAVTLCVRDMRLQSTAATANGTSDRMARSDCIHSLTAHRRHHFHCRACCKPVRLRGWQEIPDAAAGRCTLSGPDTACGRAPGARPAQQSAAPRRPPRAPARSRAAAWPPRRPRAPAPRAAPARRRPGPPAAARPRAACLGTAPAGRPANRPGTRRAHSATAAPAATAGRARPRAGAATAAGPGRCPGQATRCPARGRRPCRGRRRRCGARCWPGARPAARLAAPQRLSSHGCMHTLPRYLLCTRLFGAHGRNRTEASVAAVCGQRFNLCLNKHRKSIAPTLPVRGPPERSDGAPGAAHPR